MPTLTGFMDDHIGLGSGSRNIKPANALMLRCTEFDENGKPILMSGEFKKTELGTKYSLLPRDLRKIDSSVLPHIMVRPTAILINLLHLRCLIKHNRVLIFDSYGSSQTHAQSLFVYDLQGKLQQKASPLVGNLPYEFRALEAVLQSVTTALESELDNVRKPVVRVLQELEEDIDRDKLRHLLIYSKKLTSFEQKARLVRDAIDDLLEADDDLAAMYLTEKANGHEREEDNHEDVELLLESYHKVADEIVQVASALVSAIRNTEEIVRAILDANRNSLMLLELKVSIGTMGISVGMFVAALYGMNLENFIEETNWGFWGVSGFSFVISMIACVYGLRQLRKVQRLRMRPSSTTKSDRYMLRLTSSAEKEDGSRSLGEAVKAVKNADRMKKWGEVQRAWKDVGTGVRNAHGRG
ncbi:magnesium ion transporter [Recurvomyces mirabilis]|uniref:Magnesium transporter n=1 Tax=Recurvomyces mirabilis TaxID=574656 RepID=A0AAE0WK07_9PEZI|nr:magnesium ion transporter [Recurvomyces mirabilis]KAK5153362.1 magnesium ion transporter [Recurvomyces mirabilis]